MSWERLRQQLGEGGPVYWRGLEELAQTQEFQEMLQREFPEQAGEWNNPLTRRQFLILMAASLALGGISGCSMQPPVGKIVPYVRQPEQLTAGKPLYYATAMSLGGVATGLLVESHEGRPTKVEGNVLHPGSLGGTDVFAQAAILELYDPDRSQSVTYLEQPRGWDEAVNTLRAALEKQRAVGGKGLRILTETITSPTLGEQLLGANRSSMRSRFPFSHWHQYEPITRTTILEGGKLAFGRAINPIYDFTRAKVVLSLESNFLGCGPGHLRYVRDFMSQRRVQGKPADTRMNRLYVVESMPSPTGAVGDHRLPMRAEEIEGFARALAVQLGIEGIRGGDTGSEKLHRWVRAIAKDLGMHRGEGLVIVGETQPATVHALAHLINQTLGNHGTTVAYTDPIEVQPQNQLAEIEKLVQAMAKGEVEILLILGGNPVFNAPVDLGLIQAMQKVPLRVHLGLYHNETAANCHWHIPETHFLEAWSDCRAYDGTVSIIQPLIAPLYRNKSVHEFVSVLFGGVERTGYDLVRDYWREHWPGRTTGTNFEGGWERALHDGIVQGTTLESRPGLRASTDWLARTPVKTIDPNAMELVFRSDPGIYDGRFANNGWLQELPRPLSKLTWDNAVFLSPATARSLGVKQTVGIQGGEHGDAITDQVELTFQGNKVVAPVWIMPGHPDGSLTVSFGHGRTRAGHVGTGTGFDAYRLRTSRAMWFGSGVQARKTGGSFTLACTQMHHAMEERDPVRSGTLAEYIQHPHFAAQSGGELQEEFQEELVPVPHPHPGAGDQSERRLYPLTLYPGYDYSPPRNRWGMSIDLSVCVGCNACVVACQAENNSPVVGKTEVTRGREMHWLRIDRYYTGDPFDSASVKTYLQPVLCMQCENAPCELVCPVGATVHSADGLNDMVYNRCVGTRYCSNNCPYKVRRFNFLQYADYATNSLKLGRNPEVTVRSRGVMEKCTYCVQRIRGAQIEAEIEHRPVRDGDILTACQAVCPAQAIVFGDMNDPTSEVVRCKKEPRHYGLLAELNTRPRTTYLATLRNPNPELE